MNKCGECTLCCELLPIKWLGKPMNTPCIHCDAGCLIHDTKDPECSGFDCMWRESGIDNDKLRPDRCGVVFEKTDDDNIYGNVRPGGNVSDAARMQMKAFVAQGYTLRLSEQV